MSSQCHLCPLAEGVPLLVRAKLTSPLLSPPPIVHSPQFSVLNSIERGFSILFCSSILLALQFFPIPIWIPIPHPEPCLLNQHFQTVAFLPVLCELTRFSSLLKMNAFLSHCSFRVIIPHLLHLHRTVVHIEDNQSLPWASSVSSNLTGSHFTLVLPVETSFVQL